MIAPHQRKYPHPIAIPFTQTRLKEEAERVKALGLDQIEFSCTVHRGMRAVIYASGRIVLYCRYSYRKRPYRIKLGELGLLTLDQARVSHQRYRLQASQGEDPKAPKLSTLTYRELHAEHYVVQCRASRRGNRDRPACGTAPGPSVRRPRRGSAADRNGRCPPVARPCRHRNGRPRRAAAQPGWPLPHRPGLSAPIEY